MLAQEPAEIPADVDAQTRESGLKISVLKKGEGKGPTARLGDTVHVRYKGWLEDGSSFDSSFSRGDAPTSFQLGQVIPGWNEGLQNVPAGSILKLTIPAELAYKDTARPGIPANSTLIFWVELVKIERNEKLPDFQTVEAGASGVTTDEEAKISWRVEKAGEGDPIGKVDAHPVHLTGWSKGGDLLMNSLERSAISVPFAQIGFPFLPTVTAKMAPGAVVWVLVAPGQDFDRRRAPPSLGAEESTIWRVELVKPLKSPTFELPADSELTTTESGLKYKILAPGRPEGAVPGPSDQVTCHYIGWLTDGTSFDGSYQRGEPSTFGLNQVIKGWTEGVPLIREGGKILLVIPSDLAYGPQGRPGIPGGATLVFVIELLKIQG